MKAMESKENMVARPNEDRTASVAPAGAIRLEISVARQEARVFFPDGSVRTYPVSTSRFGLGTKEGSFCTPLGSFRIAEKIGAGAPLWSVFRARQPTGHLAPPGGEEDLVLTRIFWLEGLDPENANTKERYIYFHGTNQEHLIGQPASHGCIRLRNSDMAELFESVPEGAHVVIR
jgi:lipoprotein-anchoring transpeptidase ErfK/SrfK